MKKIGGLKEELSQQVKIQVVGAQCLLQHIILMNSTFQIREVSDHESQSIQSKSDNSPVQNQTQNQTNQITQFHSAHPSHVEPEQMLHLEDVFIKAHLEKKKQLKQEEYNFYVHEKKFNFGRDAYYLFSESSQIRKHLVWVTQWEYFDKIVMGIILLNTISLALQNYDFRVNGNDSQSQLTIIRGQMEYFFTAFFVTEFLLKSIAMGFVMEPNTYLRNPWNLLDFTVVITSILSLIGSINLSAIRTIRILRPLRSIKAIPGLQILVGSLMDSLPSLANVVIFLGYLLILFGILGLQLFSGAFENRCRIVQQPFDNGTWPANPNITQLCSSNSDCPVDNYCGNPSNYNLPFQDEQIAALSYDYTTFDNILVSFFTLFQAITTQGWSDTCISLSHTVSPYFVYTYFLIFILIGSFFTMNLILAVINDQFLRSQQARKSEIFKEETQRRMLKREKKLKERQQAKVHPLQQVIPSEDSDDSDEEAKKKKEELIKSVLKPAHYIGRAQGLKMLQDDVNKKMKERDHVNYFDPALATLDQGNQIKGETIQMLRLAVYRFIDSFAFIMFINIMIVLNIVALSLVRFPQPQSEVQALVYVNLVFTTLFTVEMCLKLFAMGFEMYFRDRMNIFDSVIVVISLAEQILDQSNISLTGSNLSIVTAFRVLRILRIFKLARSWASFREILIAIASTFESISYFGVLLILFMVVSALIGMELFAYNIPVVRLTFNTFPDACITVFTVLTGEAWNNLSYSYMLAEKSYWPAVYYVLVLIVGQFILLNLFQSILIYNFGQKSIEAEKKLQDKAFQSTVQQMMDKFKSSIGNREERESKIKKKRKINPNYMGPATNSDVACFFLGKYDEARFEARKQNIQKKVLDRFFQTAEVVNPEDVSDDSSDEELDQEVQRRLQQSNDQSSRKSIFLSRTDSTASVDIIEEALLYGKSLYIFDAQSKIRRGCLKIVNKTQFVGFIVVLIIISSILLALQDPLSSNAYSAIPNIDLVITCMFAVEMMIKIIGTGFIINGEASYLRDVANILDFVIIIISITDQFVTQNLSIFKVLRVFRVLRPLRLIARNESLKVAINALVLSIPKLGNLLLVNMLFYLMFGIFGVSFFKGQFYECSLIFDYDESGVGPWVANITTKNDCLDLGGDWVNNDYNFDNVGEAMSTLFTMSTTQGWVKRMEDGIDHTGIDLQPIYNYNKTWSIFYITFMIVGSFFMMNLFSGVVLDAFNSEKEKIKGYFFLSLEQQEWVDIQERIFACQPEINYQTSDHFIRSKAATLINHPYFDKIIFLMIVINTIIFMIQYQRQPSTMTLFIQYSNWFFMALFTLEMILKQIALGKYYFYENYNVFDFIVVILTIVSTLFDQFHLFTSVGTAISVLRSFRITRIMRLIRSAKSLRLIFETFIVTLPELGSIGGLLCIILFMYAILGLNIYPYTKYGRGITPDVNFQTIPSALFLLFKSSTGESWDEIQADMARDQQSNNVCYSVSSYQDYATYGINGCGNWSGYIYFMSFQLLFSMILMNLFVAVIITGYDKIEKDELSQISTSHLAQFVAQWRLFDFNATGLIQAKLLPELLSTIPKPLGWNQIRLDKKEKDKYIAEYRLPVYIDDQTPYYFFYDILQILSHGLLIRKYGEDVELEPKNPVKVVKDLVRMKLSLLHKITYATSVYTSRDIVAGSLILQKLRLHQQARINRQIKPVTPLSSQYDDLEDQEDLPAPSTKIQTQGQLSGHASMSRFNRRERHSEDQ